MLAKSGRALNQNAPAGLPHEPVGAAVFLNRKGEVVIGEPLPKPVQSLSNTEGRGAWVIELIGKECFVNFTYPQRAIEILGEDVDEPMQHLSGFEAWPIRESFARRKLKDG